MHFYGPSLQCVYRVLKLRSQLFGGQVKEVVRGLSELECLRGEQFQFKFVLCDRCPYLPQSRLRCVDEKSGLCVQLLQEFYFVIGLLSQTFKLRPKEAPVVLELTNSDRRCFPRLSYAGHTKTLLHRWARESSAWDPTAQSASLHILAYRKLGDTTTQ